jgi:hypothetical protein
VCVRAHGAGLTPTQPLTIRAPEPSLPGLELVNRPRLFESLRVLDAHELGAMVRCSFGDRRGWLISDGEAARAFLASSVGVKGRPEHSARRLGGIGAAAGRDVRRTKRDLIAAMRLAAADRGATRDHVTAALSAADPPITLGRVTEGFAAAMLGQILGLAAGAVYGSTLRTLVAQTWKRLESPAADEPPARDETDDELAGFIAAHLSRRTSSSLDYLRGAGWDNARVTTELRGMLLASWGSTTAATLSALALEADLTRPFGFEEVLRLYPPSFMIARTIEAASPAAPFVVGDVVVISPWLLHRHPHGWDNPHAFDPLRWRGRSHLPWFLPFGLGPRRCPASGLARAQATVGAALLRPIVAGPPTLTMVEGRSPALVPEAFMTTIERPLATR